MTIQTKYEKGDYLYFVHRDSIISRKVKGISWSSDSVIYSFDEYTEIYADINQTPIFKEEQYCFKSIEEMFEYYKKSFQ